MVDYHLEHSFSQESIETYFEDVLSFLMKEGEVLTRPLSSEFMDLLKYKKKEAAIYNKKLKIDSIIKKADKAWQEKDYYSFYRLFEGVDLSELPSSYQKKIKYSLKKAR